MQVAWTPGASENLSHLRRYIAERNPRAAAEVVRKIFTASERLAEYPQLGRVGRISGTRELPVPGTPYLMVYRIRAAEVEILRVLHGAQEWPPT